MKYKTILVDPPWPYDDRTGPIGTGDWGKKSGIENIIQVGVSHHYDVMSIDELKSIDVKSISEEDAHLYLWTTNAFICEAHEVARAWGFVPKTIITWVKIRRSDGQPSMRSGHYYRGATEHILFCIKGKLKLRGSPHPTAFFTYRTAHSVKPDYSYLMIEEHSYPPRIELFARKKRPGWDAWGNEVDCDTGIVVDGEIVEYQEEDILRRYA